MGHIKREDLMNAEVFLPSKKDYKKIDILLKILYKTDYPFNSYINIFFKFCKPKIYIFLQMLMSQVRYKEFVRLQNDVSCELREL